jgi:hypothetical protein
VGECCDQVLLLAGGVVVPRPGLDAHNVIAAREERLRQMRAYESSDTSDDASHLPLRPLVVRGVAH